MIESAEEFRRLRTSEDPADYERAANDEAPFVVWNDIIQNIPEMRFWVAHNKTVPQEIMRALIEVGDARTRSMIAMKRSLPETLQKVLAVDADEGVRLSLCRNKKVAASVLAILVDDPWVTIAEEAQEKLQQRDTG